MGKAEAVKVKEHPVSLKSIVPVVPRDEGEKLIRQLIKDLIQIGYKGLLAQPWSLRSKENA